MPLNRFITFVKPYLNLFAGAIAAWLVAKANVLGISGLGEHGSELQTGIAAALAWGVTQAVTQIGDLKWLRGHHLAMIGDAKVQAAVLNAPTAAPQAIAPPAQDAAYLSLAEDLPDDDEEFAAPPLQAPAPVPYVAPEAEDEALGPVDDDLPDDDEEFAAPPPDETNTPVQPSQFEAEEVAA